MSMFNYSESAPSNNLHFDQPISWPQQSIRTVPDQSEDPMDDAESQTPRYRVCDRCMVKKVKCNRQLPSCSRCAEEGATCLYSSAKRKPGPAKGSRRKRQNVNAAHSDSFDFQQQLSPTSTAPIIQNVPQAFNSLEDLFSQNFLSAAFTPEPSLESTTTFSVGHGSNHGFSTDPQLPAAQERQLLEDFFTYIQPSIPLFRRDPFFARYEQGIINRELLLTLVAVSAQIQGAATVCGSPALKSFLDYLLLSCSLEEESVHGAVSLEEFQKACLLAFYGFHQYPGTKAWQRISDITRKAYQYGLHQIDNRDICPLYDRNQMMDEEAEDWRCLWWCIYCLDSYCNITAATPFVVELESVRTALVQTSRPNGNNHESSGAIFLPVEPEMLWKITKEIISRPEDPNPNIHIVTTTLLKEAGALLRLWKQNPSDRLKVRFSNLEDNLSAVRLALPSRYLNVARNAVVNESTAKHHARLICILHIHAARLLISLPVQESVNSAEWLSRWQGTIEHCEEVVAVVRQWKAQQCLSVDPAICFIISGVITILHLHSRDRTNLNSELQSRVQMQKDLLKLFLEQFASIWHLPRLLIVSSEKLFERFSNPLTTADIDQLLRKWQGSLHPGWFRTIALTLQDLQSSTVPDYEKNLLAGSDFNDWESWANVSDMNFVA